MKEIKSDATSKACRLVFAGDLLPCDRDHTIGIGAGTKLDTGAPLWTPAVSKLFLQADFTFVNLEAPLVKQPRINGKFAFAGREKILDYLCALNLTHANIANNHILEHGFGQFYKTRCLLQESGIDALGVQENGDFKINFHRINGMSIAIAGFNAVHDIPDTQGCYTWLTDKTVMAALDNPLMKNADIRILSFHWGNEYIPIPSWDQIQLARKAVDAGAHLVIGHHPHVIQPIEVYKTGLICYSLGNFVFDMLWGGAVKTGLIIEVLVEEKKVVRWQVHSSRNHSRQPVSLLNQKQWISRRLENSKLQMDNLLKQGEAAYRKVYNRKLFFYRLFARLMMKVQLIFQLPRIPQEYRNHIIRSLVTKPFIRNRNKL